MKDKFSEYAVLIYIAFFILSNSIFVSLSENVELDSGSYLYWFRHGVVVFISIISIFLLNRNDLKLIFSILLISSIYFISNQFLLGLMSISLAFSCTVFGRGFKIISENHKLLIFIILIIGFFPLMYNFREFLEIGFLSAKYGRERMLLGYFHPKEAAQPFLISIILLYISFSRFRALILIIGLILLSYISSKNAILYLLVFTFLTSNFKGKSIVFFLFISFLFFYLFILINNFYSFMDEVSSDRLSAWTSVIGSNGDIDADQFRADSFYIELFVKAGLTGVAIFIIWLFLFFYQNKPFEGIFNSLPIGVSLIIALLFYAGIDSGITSSGSLVHLFSWSMYGSLPKKLI